MDQRIASEKAFHEVTLAEKTRSPAYGFYDIVDSARAAYRAEVTRLCTPGCAMLECGVGTACFAIPLAAKAGEVTGIDISEVAVQSSIDAANEMGITNARFLEMNAEDLQFPDDSFDMICGRSIVHHLILDRAYGEAARVLKPTGSAVFYEPLGHNSLINAYRNRTPDLRTPDEHPLLMRDIARAKQYFSKVECRYFCLCSLAALPFRRFPGFRLVATILNGFDRVLLAAFPPLRRYSWIVLMTLSEPIKDNA